MHYSSASANCAGPPCLGTARRPTHVSGGQKRKARIASHAPASCQPARFATTQPECHQWDTVQEMLLASRPRFVRQAYSILQNKEDAEDAVQDAMLSAYLHLRSFEGRSAFTTWFTRIVFNAALMIRRKRKPSRMESFSDSGTTDEPPWTESIPALQPDPEMVCAEAETFHRIDNSLRKMSPLLREAFTLAYYDEMSVEEAGALLGVTAGTFKSRVFRARQHLSQRTQRSLVAPIHSATHVFFCSGKNAFTRAPARLAETPSPEVAPG